MRTIFAFVAIALLAGCAEKRDAEAPYTRASLKKPDAEGFVTITGDDAASFPKAGRIELLPFFWEGKSKDREEENMEAGRGVDGKSLTFRGNSRGYFHTRKSYRDFTLRLDFRWPKAAELPEDERPSANTGVLVFITGEDKIWPKCLEVQGKWSELGHIKSNAKDVTVEVRDDEEARQNARKPVGEWNSLEIVSKDGALTSFVNGVKVAESDPTELREGRLGFQAERFDVEFRNVRIREE